MSESTGSLPASKTTAWADGRNARRRELYAQNTAYRKKEIERSRANYRDRVGSPEISDFSTGKAGTHGVARLVDGRSHKIVTYTIKELASAVGYNSQIIGRWVRDERIPEPILKAGHLTVYSYAEVRAIMAVLSKHLKDTAYYRTDHHATRAKMFAAINTIRHN